MGCCGSKKQTEAQKGPSVSPEKKAPGKAAQQPKPQKKSQKQKESEVVAFYDAYELMEKLGEGAFGLVHQVRCKADGDQQLAVKMIDLAYGDEEETKNETDMMRKLAHANIVKLVDVFVDKCFWYIVMVKYECDLVDALEEHLEEVGVCGDVQTIPVLRQMLLAISFMHEKGVVHRDVKGDNFLCDRHDITDPDIHLVCSDLGTAVVLSKGSMLSEQCGTKLYWPPEVINKSYGFLVDEWGIGVCYYGLLAGTFPFRDTNEALKSKPVIPKCNKECANLLMGLLEKDVAKRLTAKAGLDHPFLKYDPRSFTGEVEKPAGNAHGFHHEQANQAVAQRRAQLLRRLEEAYDAKHHDLCSLQWRSKVLQGNFAVEGLLPGEKLLFEWLDEAESVTRGVENGAVSSDSSHHLDPEKFADVPPHVIEDILDKFGVNTSLFGVGVAKGLDEFVLECVRGDAILVQDCKRLIRVTDVIAVVLHDNLGKRILVETLEILPDGRERKTNRLPAHKRRAHENVADAAFRVVTDFLQMGREFLNCLRWGDCEEYEESQESPSYPGVQTVYRKFVMTADIIEAPGQDLGGIGLPGYKNFSTELEDGLRMYQYHWAWMDKAECDKFKIKLHGDSEISRFSCGLAPIRFEISADDIQHMMKKHGVDVSKFGRGLAMTLDELADEVEHGECDLVSRRNDMVRFVSHVDLRLRNPHGKVLVESVRQRAGVTTSVNRLVGGLQHIHENAFHTARRIVTTVLKLQEGDVSFDLAKSELFEEKVHSDLYPGLLTIEKTYVVDAMVNGEDPGVQGALKAALGGNSAVESEGKSAQANKRKSARLSVKGRKPAAQQAEPEGSGSATSPTKPAGKPAARKSITRKKSAAKPKQAASVNTEDKI